MINFRDPNEDLFDDSRMSFGEHLEELRKVLVRSIIWIVLGCVVGFLGAEKIVEILQLPLNRAVVKFKQGLAEDGLKEEFGYIPPDYLPHLEAGWVPDQVMVDAGQLVSALQTVIPDFGEAVNLAPYQFRASHFKRGKVVELCRMLVGPSDVNGSSEVNPGAEAIVSLLSGSAKQKVTQVAAVETASPAQLTEVLSILNGLLDSKELMVSPAFKEKFETPAWSLSSLLTKPPSLPLLSAKETIDDPATESVERKNLLRKLNRSLISEIFAAQMEPVKLDTVPLEIWRPTDYKPQSLGVTEPFFVWLKAGLLGGLTISAPFVFYQIWSFVAAGLYPQEKKYVHVFLPVSLLLFAAGVCLAFFFVFSPVLEFLFTFNKTLNIAPEIRIGEWLSFAMFLPLGFGVAFQLPLVMLFVNRIGLITVQAYLDKWRIAIMVIFILSMFLTPADPISMLLLAMPLTGLYFLGIAMCQFLPRPENPFGAEAA
jgi:sec-independent protein translocase protein TatC